MYVVFIILSIIVAFIRKGRFSNIRYFRFSLWYLLILAFIIYAGYIVGTIMEIQFVLDYAYWIYFAVYVLIMITVVFNLHNIWSYILVVGVGLNFTATFLNGGKMPILQSALDMARITDNGQLYLSYFGATNQLTITNPYVMSLCKIMGIPLGVTGLPISAGDIIVAISMFFIIQKMMVVPQARKATPQERLAYTDQLKYTSEFNLDEIAKAAKETPENFDAPIISPSPMSRLGDTQNNLQNKKNTYNDDALLADDISANKKDNIQLAFDDELENASTDLTDDDEFDSFLQKLDNINKKEDEKEVFDTVKEEDIAQEEPDVFDKLISEPTTAEESVLTETTIEPELEPEPETEQENENIAKLLDDLQPAADNKQIIEDRISDDDLQLVDDEEIQNIVSELIKNDDSVIDDYEDEELNQQKTDNADEMLSYMLNIFDKHKKTQTQPVELKQDEDEEIISISAAKSEYTETYVSKPKIDLFDDIRNEYDKNQQNESYSNDGVDTTNPFIIENGRIIENPNYKFRKSNEPEPKKTEPEITEEPIIAFDSTQNLEFIRKEIFSELKKQEEAASNSTFKSGQIKNDNINPSSAPEIKAANESDDVTPSDKNGTKDEYERVEFEIDGKTMYVWIKK